jgi:hypothetical protein
MDQGSKDGRGAGQSAAKLTDPNEALKKVLIRCEVCKRPMTVVCLPCRSAQCSAECVDQAHAHVRCEECSPPDWWTSIHFVDEVPSQGKKAAVN